MRCLLLCLLLVSPLARADGPGPDGWEVMNRDDGIETFRREVPGSPVIALKGRGKIDAPAWKVAAVILGTKRAPEWVDSLEESRVIRMISPTSYIEYNHIGTPFIMKDRDFVSQVDIKVDRAAQTIEMSYRPTDDPGVPVTGHVRGEIITGSFRIVPVVSGRSSELNAELHCDPKGSVAKWIVNLFQKGWPKETFEGLRKQVLRPDVVIQDEFKEALAPSLHF